jgi:very-short-patch-repair endonuclease
VKYRDAPTIPRLSALAAGQHGVLSVGQLGTAGVTRRGFDQLVRRGIFVRVAPGVYAGVAAPDTWERKLMAGLLALGPTARISHDSAAHLHGFDRSIAGRVEFTVDRSHRNATARGTVHSTSRTRPLDVVTLRSFRVTSATRTVVDLARARVPSRRLAASIDSAVRLGLSSPVVLQSELRFLRGPGRWGCRLLDELLLDAGGHTMLERDFLRLMRRGDLPRPRTQVIHRRDGATFARVDFLFDPYNVVVEVSGRKGHSSPDERQVDAQRRNELQDAGRQVFEYTYADVARRPDHVVATMTRRLCAAGWTR